VSQKPVARSADSYVEHRRSLVRTSIPTAAASVFGVTLAYVAADLVLGPDRSGSWLLLYVLQLAIPAVAWGLVRAPLRSHAEWVVLAADMLYTAAVAAHGLFPRTATSSLALVLSLKMVATALFFPWGAALQCASAAATVGLYLGALGASDRFTPSPELFSELLCPLIAAVLSAVGAARAERVRRAFFEQERSLADSQERYRMVSELASDYAVACRIEPEGTIVVEWITEAAFTRMTGYRPDAFPTRKHPAAGLVPTDAPVHPDDLPIVADALRKLVAGESVEVEYRLVTKTGEVRWARSVGKPVWDESARRAIGFYAAVRDVTAHKRAEEAHRQLEQQRADFLAMITHDLKQPITLILGSVAHLRELGGVPPDVANALDLMNRGSRQLLELLDNFLQTSQIDAGVVSLSRHPVALDEVLATVCAGYTEQARQRRIRLDVEHGTAGAGRVLGDRLALERVFANLLSNALKFTPDGGHIVVRARHDDLGIMVNVVDSGPGIAAEEIPLLFARYRQTAQGRSRGGSGLGLFIVKSLVAAHGGSVNVESQVGHGTTFTVRLPPGEAMP